MQPKEHNNFSVTHAKEMEIYILLNKEYKIVVYGKHCKLQENTDRPLNEIRKTIKKKQEAQQSDRNHF